MADETFTGYVRAMWRVHVLVLRDCTTFVPVGLADLLRKSAALMRSMPGTTKRAPIDLALVSAAGERTVAGAGGVRIRCDATLREVRASDLVLVPALDPDIAQHLALNAGAVPWLRRMFAGGADVASACTGAFLLAEAGLLDGRSATTHWAFQPELRTRYPRVSVEPEAILVDQGRIVTAGGATAFVNLALYLVERMLGREVARAASKMFLVDVNKPPQSAYAIFATQKAHGDGDVLRAQQLMEADPGGEMSLEVVARKVAMSRRNFVRRFRRATGNTPREYLQRVRVELAKRALEDGPRSVAAVAREAGYSDAIAFRKVFARCTGMTPAAYRERYGPRSAPAVVVAGSRPGGGRPLRAPRR
jgi:transcriptional regulator GlxA family with amidase domain